MRTKPFLCIVFLAALLSGCAASGPAASEIEADIPDSAFEIHLYSERSQEDFLGLIRRNLEMQGFAVLRYSAVDQNLATATTDIGRQVSLAVFVEVDEDLDINKTRAKISGIQGRDGQAVGTARWNGTDDNLAFAFSRLAQIANRIEHESVIYAIE